MRNQVAEMLAHLAWENKEFSRRYAEQLLALVGEAEFHKLQRYQRPLVRLLQLHDSLARDRAKKVVEGLYSLLRNQRVYYKFCDSIIELIFKLSRKSKLVYDYVRRAGLRA